MKMAELLRHLADKLDDIESPAGQEVSPKSVQNTQVQPKMLNPQQAKLELLKKGVGVESEYDNESDAELGAIKRNAGISPAVIQIAADDDPME